MSCSSCMHRENPCGCKKKKSCDDCPVVDWVPNTACTIGVTMNGCTDTLELRPGIQNCETKTVFGQNPKTGCIEYQNELYVATDGQEGYIMSVCPVDIAKFINLEDLANVEDEQPENCSLLVYKAESDCGPGCTGIADTWYHWYASEHLTNGLHWVAGFNENGCLEALDVPTDVNEYWWAMYRPNDTGTGLEFGYIQPEEVNELPTDEDGNIIVISQKADGQPVVGKIVQPKNLVYDFTTRPGDPTDLNKYFVANSVAQVDIICTPENNTNWRAPADGIMIINYCVNAIDQGAGLFEVDVTPVLDNQSWSQTAQNNNSSHTNWDFSGDSTPRNSSEGVSRTLVVPKGRTAKLCAKVLLGGSMAGRWRVHSIHCTFIPTVYQVL